ncbi:MAG: putative glycoside hydrolase [archaeon]|nr:putative glycoside hydrolase [archaeon]
MKKFLFSLIFFLFLLSSANAVCSNGGICTFTMQNANVNADDQANAGKFDYIMATASGVGINVSTPNIADFVDPSIPVVLYSTFVVMNEFNQPQGVTCNNKWPEVNNNEDWFLHDFNFTVNPEGERLEEMVYCGAFEMDVTNIDYQNYTASKSAEVLQPSCALGVDGYFFDQTSDYARWLPLHVRKSTCTIACRPNFDWDTMCSNINQPVDCSNCPFLTQQEFEGGVISTFQKVKAEIGSSKYLMINGDYTGYTPYIDNQMYEGWVHAGWNSPNQYSLKAQMVQEMNWLKNSVFANRSATVVSGASSTSSKVRDFTFAAYLLAKRNDSFAYFQYDDRGTTTRHDYYAELFDLDLGLAIDGVSCSSTDYCIIGSGNNDVYVRDFANGKVLANFNSNSSPSINLGGTYKKLNGTIVTTITLADHEGIVLLNATTPACTDKDGDGYGTGCALGLDCDDQNPLIHPNAAEICGNLIDEDCSGADLQCPIPITCGNGTIDSGENCSTCPADVPTPAGSVCCSGNILTPACSSNSQCNDDNVQTIDSCANPNSCSAVCQNLQSCQDNNYCSAGEACCNNVCVALNCSNDSQCSDNDSTTLDDCINANSCNSYCSNTPINQILNPLCGNNRIDSGENCSLCPSDVSCVAGRVCNNGLCVLPECSNAFDCDDGNSCTIDSCSNNSCSHSTNPACNAGDELVVVVSESAVAGEKFFVSVFDKSHKPIVGANAVYGKQFGFTNFAGAIEFEAVMEVNKIEISKIGYKLASANIEVLEAESVNLASFFDVSSISGLFKSPIALLSVAGIIVGIGLFFLLMSQFKHPQNDE